MRAHLLGHLGIKLLFADDLPDGGDEASWVTLRADDEEGSEPTAGGLLLVGTKKGWLDLLVEPVP